MRSIAIASANGMKKVKEGGRKMLSDEKKTLFLALHLFLSFYSDEISVD